MLGNNRKKSLSHKELLYLIDIVESATSVRALLYSAAKELGVKHSLYQHFAAVGSVDFTTRGHFHPYRIPQEIVEFYKTNTVYDKDPVIVAAFARSKFFWLSDSIHERAVIEADHNKAVNWVIEKLGDGLCFPLYGPDNRRGYAFVGLGRAKADFDPVLPYQIQTFLQAMHVRYSFLLSGLQQQIKLTKREAEVLELISYGKTNPDIALILGISPRTVAVHVSKVFLKLGTTDRVSAAMRAQTLEITL